MFFLAWVTRACKPAELGTGGLYGFGRTVVNRKVETMCTKVQYRFAEQWRVYLRLSIDRFPCRGKAGKAVVCCTSFEFGKAVD